MIRNSHRPFVEECERVPASPEFIAAAVWATERSKTVQLSVDGKPFTFVLVSTDQRLGGVRWWWECQTCKRRCRWLLRADDDGQFACRVCWKCVYRSDYPRATCFYEFVNFFHTGELVEGETELKALLAPRRRGVRRGRRVRARSSRLLDRMMAALSGPPFTERYWRLR